jgi:hypothetical protein
MDKYFDLVYLERLNTYGIQIFPKIPDAGVYRILYKNAPKDLNDPATRGEIGFTNLQDALEYKKILEFHIAKLGL